jgi:hypothetical protein
MAPIRSRAVLAAAPRFIVLWVALAAAVAAGCAGSSGSPTTPGSTSPEAAPASAKASPPASGSDAALAELDRLNRWCASHDDCDVHERPAAYPGRKAHGETNGFILDAKERLRGLGVAAVWDGSTRRYRIAPSR